MFFFFKQKTAYEISACLVGSEMCIRDRRIPEYEFQIQTGDKERSFKDAYGFGGILTEEDETAFLCGVYYEGYKKLGAHPMVMNGVSGTHFAVWAPNAIRVSVVGDFNDWDGRVLPMHKMPKSGIFQLFVPGVKVGDCLLYTSPSPRDRQKSRMPSSA